MAGVDVGTAYLTVVPSTRGFSRGLQSQLAGGMGAAGSRAGDAASESFGKKFKSGLKKAAIAGGVALAGGFALGGKIISDSINAASDLNETSTKIEAIFGKGSVAVQDFAKKGAAALGQSKQSVLDASATFGTFGKAAGLGGKDLAKFSTDFAGLSTDLASFNNTSPEQAVEAIGAALRGESEPLRSFGVLLDDATLRQEALKLGLIKNTKEALTPANKVLAAQAAIYKQTKDAQGDFAKTSGGLANQQRILAAKVDDAKAALGERFLPFAVKAATALNDFSDGMKNGTGAGGKFVAFLQKVKTGFEDAIQAFRFGDEWESNSWLESVAVQARHVVDAVKNFVSEFKAGEGAGGLFRDSLEKIVTVAQNVGTWIRDNADTVRILAGAIGGAIVAFKIASGVVKAYTAVQAALNVVMALNPIGIVVIAIGALVGAFIVAYKQSKTFRDIVNNTWDTVKLGALQFAKGAVTALKNVVTFFLGFVSTFVTGAAKAFGWVPGLGPKLKTAAANVSTFKDNANAALAKVEKSLEISANTTKAQNALNDLRRNAGKPITVPVFMSTRYTAGRVNVAGLGPQNAGNRASGGPVSAGKPYWVGENRDGSLNKTSELFVPNQSGTIYNQQQLGGAGGGGFTEANLQRLASILRGTPLVATISRGAVDQGLMSGYRA